MPSRARSSRRYFRATAGDSQQTAHQKAFEHRTALSHVLGTKLKEGAGTLTDSDVASALFGATCSTPLRTRGSSATACPPTAPTSATR